MVTDAHFWGRRAELESWVTRKNATSKHKLHLCQFPTRVIIDAVRHMMFSAFKDQDRVVISTICCCNADL